MTIQEVEAIKEKLQDKKTGIGVANKQLEKIMESLKEDYEVDGIKEAKAYALTLEKDIKVIKGKEQKQESEIEKLLEAMEDDEDD